MKLLEVLLNKKNHRSFGYIRKLKSGRYQASYLAPDKTRKYAPNTFTVLKDANAWLSRQQSSLERGTWVDVPKVTVREKLTPAEIFEDYVSSRITKRGQPLSGNTVAHYRNLLDGVLLDLKDIPFEELSSIDVENWYSKRVRSGRVTTASKGYKLLKAMCSWAVTRGIIASNPCKINGAQTATTGKTINVPTAEEVRAISREMPDSFAFAVMLGAYAGLRYGELTELRRKDLIFSSQKGIQTFQVSITRAVVWYGGKFQVGKPKSKASVRTIDVTTALIPEALTHLEKFVQSSPDSLLFPDTELGGHLKHDKFIRVWNRSNTKNGLSGRMYTPHSLRHFGATNLVLCGATLPDLKQWLGDSSTEAVTRYLHATGRQKSLTDAMEFFK
jgi:integrase